MLKRLLINCEVFGLVSTTSRKVSLLKRVQAAYSKTLSQYKRMKREVVSLKMALSWFCSWDHITSPISNL